MAVQIKHSSFETIISIVSDKLQEKKMSSDSHVQKLFQDGVHKDHYFTQRNWYQNCGECSAFFNIQNEVPALLKCGHVCCQQCSKEGTPCPCCRAPKDILRQTYGTILGVFDTPSTISLQEEPLYDFHVSIRTGYKAIDVRNQKGSTTIGNILTQFDDFKEYQKKINSKRIGIMIKSKTFFYHDIKDKPISQFAKLLFTTKTKHSNPISVLDRHLGGK